MVEDMAILAKLTLKVLFKLSLFTLVDLSLFKHAYSFLAFILPSDARFCQLGGLHCHLQPRSVDGQVRKPYREGLSL